ncbi:MAG: S41 family peptidase [Bacteroidota bacterium]
MEPASPRNRFASVWLPLLFALTLVFGLYIGQHLRGDRELVKVVSSDETIAGSQRIQQLLRYVDTRYVDEVNGDRLTEAAIENILNELDPHSTYISPEEMGALLESMQGNFNGIGIEFMIVEDTISVVAPLVGGPSESVGIQSGDKIIYVEDSLVAGPTARGLNPATLLRGEKGSKVEVRVQRYGQSNLLPFTITRDEIPVHSVDAAYLLNEQTAYIKINRFSDDTGNEFKDALENLVERGGARDLVIDLRSNPGGYLREAVKVLNLIFEQRGLLLVYTEGRNSNREDHKSNGAAPYRLGDIVVLMDESSASASEIVAGALQDHDRGIIVGRRSFGKGLVQEQYELEGGAGLRLTIARYYTPSGRSIQKPYTRGEGESYNSDRQERFERGELTGDADIQVDSSQIYTTNAGYTVYGGGGIVPDHFVPLDTSYNNYDYLMVRQQVPSYTFTYLDEARDRLLAAYPTLDEYVDSYGPEAAILDALTERARQAHTEDTYTIERPSGKFARDILTFFKARVSKQLYDEADGLYRVLNQSDPMIEAALELLSKPDPLAAARQ